MQEKIKNFINKVLESIQMEGVNFSIEHPEDFKNGDYSTNVAMVCSKNLKINPKELAEKIVGEMNKDLPVEISKIDVAGSGFINFHLSREFFSKNIEEILNQAEKVGSNSKLSGKRIMVEYTDPNPFKPFHIGHLMTNTIGESVARILEHSGAKVGRANYQGDVGLHVAKAIWTIKQRGFPAFTYENSSNIKKATYIGECYSFGSSVYETDPKAKEEIDDINQKLYAKGEEREKNKDIYDIYDWGFEITMEAFEDIYRLLGTKFDFYFLESLMAPVGEEIVRANIGKVFEESDGAIVFKAEKYDPKLHTRVFITSKGLPTYETKELGLTEEKFKTDPDMDLSIVVTANEQEDYMRVVAKAISLIHSEHEKKMFHITHGMMRLATGKMSSRKGNVVTGESLLRDTIALVAERVKERDWNTEEKNIVADKVGVAALKYSILKQSIGGDMIYDFEKSISLEGDSGPYLQYSYARANSIIEKAQKENILPDFETIPEEVFEIERMLYVFPEVVDRTRDLYEPHHIASYLIEVARAYNSFYGNTVIVNKEDINSSYKIAITYAFSFVMKKGLQLLGIEVPIKM